MTYKEKLLDPRWQKKRLEILERDKWACQSCSATDKTLHVHHARYKFGEDPWETPGRLLITLCTDCHEKSTIEDQKLKDAIDALWDVPSYCDRTQIIGYLQGLMIGPKDSAIQLTGYEHTLGVAQAWALAVEDLYFYCVDDSDPWQVSFRDLWILRNAKRKGPVIGCGEFSRIELKRSDVEVEKIAEATRG